MENGLQELLGIKTLVISLAITVFFVAELLWPKAPIITSLSQGKSRLWRWAKNFGLFGVNIFLAPLLVIPITLWATEIALLWREQTNLGWVFLDLILLDFALYWWHRINHVIPFLWRFHQVHHLDEFLDSSSAVRFHFGEVILSALFRMLIILALGIPLVSVVVFEILLMVFTLFHHSNLRLAHNLERGMGLLIITPALHWVHHHAKQVDTDSNYGTVLSLWDRVFASRSKTQRTDNMKIGVEGHCDLSFRQLLFAPFHKIRQRPAKKSDKNKQNV